MKQKRFLVNSLFFWGIILIVIVESYSQSRSKKILPKVSSVKPCSLKISESPKLRGFYLGQDFTELSAISYFVDQYGINSKKDEDNSKFGVVSVNESDVFYRTPGKRETTPKELDDIGFYTHFLDGKLYFVSISYREYEPENLRDFMSQISEKTNLPKDSWQIKDTYNAEMKCVGFTVEIGTGNQTGRPDYQDYPSIALSNDSAYLEISKREKALIKKRIEEEKRRKKLELEKKRTLKP
jgi:hypothetical protein